MNAGNNSSDFHMVNPAWKLAENPDLSPGFFIFSGVWLVLNFILGVTSNGVILVVFIKDKTVSL